MINLIAETARDNQRTLSQSCVDHVSEYEVDNASLKKNICSRFLQQSALYLGVNLTRSEIELMYFNDRAN